MWAINGAAAGFGMDLALLADMRIMSDTGKLAATMVKRNVVPESGGTWILPRLIGWGKAAEIFYRGLTLGAQECLQLGLANTIVAQDQVMATAMQWAQEIAPCPMAVQTPSACALAKRKLRTSVDHPSCSLHSPAWKTLKNPCAPSTRTQLSLPGAKRFEVRRFNFRLRWYVGG